MLLRFIYILSFFCVFASELSGQSSSFVSEDYHFKAAAEFYEKADFLLSINEYYRVVQKDPQNQEANFQIALCYYRLKNYPEVIKRSSALLNQDSTQLKYYRLLGNCYDVMGEYEQGQTVFQKGIKKIPRQGELFLDLGIIELIRGNKMAAINLWEKGIAKDPLCPDNYYWATIQYAQSDKLPWALMYGEIFMNLERASARFSEMSSLLFELYLTYYRADTSNAEILIAREKSNRFEEAFETTHSVLRKNGLIQIGDSIAAKRPVNPIMAVSMARTNFIEVWGQLYEQELKVQLFDWHKEMIAKGQFHAYNHYLFNNGSPQYFVQWKDLYEEEYMSFIQWIILNPIPLNYVKFFDRAQFE